VAIATLEGKAQLKTERTVVSVPHLFGPSYYKNVMEEIDSQKLYRPTTAEVLSFIDLALQNPDEPDCLEILKRFKQKQLFLWAGIEKNHNPDYVELKRRFRQGYLWTCTESLSFPEGVLVYDNKDGTIPKTSKKLLGLLNEGDQRVRFVEPGFEKGFMSISDFLKNPYTIAQIGGEDMLETAERVAKACYEREACVLGPDRADFDKRWLTALFSGCENNSGFYLNGCLNSVSHSGFSPGIYQTA
jgi:hypothetical protein